MADTRIIDLPNQVTIGEGSFVAVDSDSDGTRKYDIAQIASVTDANVIASMAERAAQIATEAAERRIDDAIDAMGDISEMAVPLMSSDVRGGAKLGEGLALTDGALGIDPAPHESTGEVCGSIASLTANGWATQDGTPTPSNLVPIQVARGRNLLQNTASSTTKNGVTFTVNADGSVTANGTATANVDLAIPIPAYVSGDFIFSGCPQGGSNSTYDVFAWDYTTNARCKKHNGTTGSDSDYGSGALCQVIDGHSTALRLRVMSGYACNNLIFYPQLELGSVATPYVPYGHVGVELQSKNLAASSLEELRANGRNTGGAWSGNTYTVKGIRFTVNRDGTITANGTSAANSTQLSIKVDGSGHAYMSGCPSGGGGDKYEIYPWDFTTGARPKTHDGSKNAGSDFGDGSDVDFVDGHENFVVIRVLSGTTVSDMTFRPQVELGNQATPYAPYLNATIPVPLPSKGFAAALSDGTADVLTIDGAGKVEWESVTGMVKYDGSNDEVWGLSGGGGLRVYENSTIASSPSDTRVVTPSICTHFVARSANDTYNGNLGFAVQNGHVNFSTGTGAMVVADWTAWLAQNPVTVLYQLATPTTEQCGYVDMPRIAGTCTVSIPELDALGMTYLIGDSVREMAEQWYARARSEYEDRITALEQAVAELVTS